MSVIIPAYDQARFLPEAIQSVLDQTHRNVEIIVVNDASPDNTDAVMAQFVDPRIRYIVHERNLRVAAARNTGINASRGEIIALLDGDDYFHSQKLEAHVRFLTERSEIGASYNARFEVDHASGTIRGIRRPPLTLGLKDLVLGFPFAPSDMVVRRDWAFEVGLFDPQIGTAEDTDFPCRLALAGCQFAGIDRALNYRRYRSGRKHEDLAARLHDVERALERVFADPRCPREVRALGRRAIKHHMMALAVLGLIQGETELAHAYLRELVQLDPSIVQGNPGELVEFLVNVSVAEENADHESVLRTMFARLPEELTWLSMHYDGSVGRGCLLKGIRATIWGCPDAAGTYFARAVARSAAIDETLIRLITHHLLGYEIEFGADAAGTVLSFLRPHLNRVARHGGDRLEGSYLVNRAFRSYRSGAYAEVPENVWRACRRHPSYLMNRGVIAIVMRSLGHIVGRSVRQSQTAATPAADARRE